MRLWPLVGILLVALVVGSVRDWPAVQRVAISLLVLLLICWLWVRLALKNVSIERRVLSGRVRVGEQVVERLSFRNLGIIPKLWVEIDDISTLPGYRPGRVISAGPRARKSWHVSTRALARGQFRLGPIQMVTGDPFGLMDRQVSLPVYRDILVYPMALDVGAIPLPSTILHGEMRRQRNAPMSSSTVAGIREYVPGDPINRISWTSSARHGRLLVKEFDPDPTADLWLLLDLSEDGQFALRLPAGYDQTPPGPTWLASTTEYVIAIGASLAERALTSGRKVGLVVNRDSPIRIDPDNTERQWLRISETLAVAEVRGNRPLELALLQDSPRFLSTQGVIVITPDPHPSWVAAARMLIERHVPVTAVVVDAGGAGTDDVSHLIDSLANAHVTVYRYPTHMASGQDGRI